VTSVSHDNRILRWNNRIARVASDENVMARRTFGVRVVPWWLRKLREREGQGLSEACPGSYERGSSPTPRRSRGRLKLNEPQMKKEPEAHWLEQ